MGKITKRRTLATTVLAVATALAGCGSGGGSSTASTAAGATAGTAAGTTATGQPPYRVALVGDETGVSSALAVPGLAGIRSYIKALDDRGGVNGRLVEVSSVQDSQTTAEGAQRAFQSALEDHPVAVLGSVSTLGVSAVPPIAGPAGIPVLFNFAPDALVIPPTPWLYTMAIPAAVQVHVMLDYLDQQLGGLKGKRVAVAAAVSGFGDGFVKAFEAESKDRGFDNAIVDRHEVKMSSFATNAVKIRDARPDAILLMDVPASTPMIVNDLRASGYSGPVIGYESAGEPKIVQAVADPGYASFRGAPVPSADNEMSKAAAAIGVTDQLSSIWFSYGWTQGAVLEAALSRCGATCDGKALISAIQGVTNLVPTGKSTYGAIGFSADKHYASTGFQFISWDKAAGKETSVGSPIVIGS